MTWRPPPPPMRKAPPHTTPGRRVVRLISGSYAFGTEMDGSDTDYRAVYQLPNAAFLGLHQPNSTHTDPLDQVAHELAHFLRLLLKGNPNLVEMPFIMKSEWLESSDTWDRIVAEREHWITRTMASAFRGWIYGEMAKSEDRTMTPKRLSHMVRLAYELHDAVTLRTIRVRLDGWRLQKVMAVKEGRLDAAAARNETEAILEEVEPHMGSLPGPDEGLIEDILREARRVHGGPSGG